MSFMSEDPTFKDRQLEHYTVFEAYRDQSEEAFAKLKTKDVDHFQCDILIRAFKFEENLEVWAKNKSDSIYKRITTYKFCSNVGELGPKRKEGDKQIPEGYYTLSKFNPKSTYFLSLKVDYPNASDSILADKQNPGGMIFIHGGCNTVGCIPITDKWIKELYVFCVEAANGGQEDIPIHIFPTRLTDENYTLLKKQFSDTKLHDFWGQLKKGYDLFEENNKLTAYSISESGEYLF
jgi:murein L,D-transpeptidase YafK|tara:strand:- start:6426 stop:7130 length:705 start_codon:yes stop_codon:yes gene_type:complete